MNALIISLCAVALILLILLFIILYAKLRISIVINNKIYKIYLGKIKIYDSAKKKKEKSLQDKKFDKDKDFEKKYKGFKYVINFFRKILDDKNDDVVFILKYIKKTFTLKKLDVALDYGFGDAAITGVTGGVIWGLISNICCFLDRYIDINEFANVAVKPHYTEKILDFNAEFSFDVRILNLLKTLRHVKRLKNTLKGGN